MPQTNITITDVLDMLDRADYEAVAIAIQDLCHRSEPEFSSQELREMGAADIRRMVVSLA